MQVPTGKTPQEIAAQYVRTVEVPTLNGRKTFVIQLLRRRVAAEVHYKSINAIVKTFLTLAGNVGAGAQGLGAMMDVIDFDTLWTLGDQLLSGATVNGAMIDMEEYFGQNPDELLPAVIFAIKTNWPGVFSKVRERLKGSLPGLVKKIKAQFPGLNTERLDGLLKIAKLQDSMASTPKPSDPGPT
jgi:hypothetical protein